MHEISTAEVFIEISKNMGDMMRFVANEPSVGLFFVQQHTQKAVPKLVNLKNNVDEGSHETTLHTEDMEESIAMIESMKECGFLIADEMIKEIKNSLSIVSTKQPKKGLLSTVSWSPANWGRNAVYFEQDVEKTSGYISDVLKSAKRSAGNFKWSQDASVEASLEPHNNILSNLFEDLSLSGQLNDEICEVSKTEKLMSMYESFDEFRADKEAKLEEWLGECDDGEREMQALGHQLFINLGDGQFS